MPEAHMKRPKPDAPLGMKPAMRTSTGKPPVKITDNSDGWSEVKGTAVPPDSQSRNFRSPLGLRPVLVGGGVLPPPTAEPRVFVPAPSDEDDEDLRQEARAAKAPEASRAEPGPSSVTVQIDWHGAKLAIPCVRAVLQPESTSRGGQGWLMLELELDPATGRPGWLPPVSVLDEDGRMSIPEFDCLVHGRRLRCEMLNVELFDRFEARYLLVLRVITELSS
jgi:hypothetical protein